MIDLTSKLLTIKEVIEMAHVSRHTLYRDIEAGTLPAIYLGRAVRIKESDAKAYIELKEANGRAPYYKDKEGV